MTTAAAVFALATTATHWTPTNLGPTTTVNHNGYTWTVTLPASGEGVARITARDGYGGTEHLDIPATLGQTIGIVEAAMPALRATTTPPPAPTPERDTNHGTATPDTRIGAPMPDTTTDEPTPTEAALLAPADIRTVWASWTAGRLATDDAMTAISDHLTAARELGVLQ